ncbi:MAG: hypothetical protein QGG08_03145 [Candidatus Poseidoniia archaeon]|nr:hypothetical protein [Candidatus Poseidoniia archaeon]
MSLDFGELTFSLTQTRSMYRARCELGGEWQPGELQPFQNLELSPAACVLNYGQGLFEGLKAYRANDGRILLFRPAMNAARLRNGCRRRMKPLDLELLCAAEGAVAGHGDGRVSRGDLQEIMVIIRGTGWFSPVEKATLDLIHRNYRFTSAAEKLYHTELSNWPKN